MKKYSSEYEKNKQETLVSLVQPFIDAIKDAELSVNDIVQEAMRRFQIEVSRFLAPSQDRYPGSYLHNIEAADMPDYMKISLLSNKKLREAYVKIGLHYIGYGAYASKDIQNEYRRTIIRELLLNELNSLPEFNLIGSQLPQAIEKSFFENDPRTTRNFEEASAIQIENRYFAVTKPVLITRPRGYFEGSTDICLRDKISNQELINATKYHEGESIKLFKSLHDAIEYAHSLQSGGHLLGVEENGTMPGIMIISTREDLLSLKFEDKLITLNEGTSSSAYSHNRRDVWVSYSTVAADTILPLAAISLYETSDFGKFRVFNTQLRLNSSNISLHSPKDKLNHALNALVDKATDLLNRGFSTEGRELLSFKNRLENTLQNFEAELKAENKLSQQAIEKFKSSCNDAFETAKNDLGNSRNYNHLIVEAFLSVITGGLYVMAMLANKVLNNKFSFFSTDTVNKLNDAQEILNNCLTHIELPPVENPHSLELNILS